jgi:hypothetical protein
VPEFAHASIDDGIAGQAALPCAQGFGILLPRKAVEVGLQVARREIRDVEQQMTAELAPTEFAEKLFDIGGQARVLGRGELRGMPDLTRTDFAEAKMR